jgi:hypothetical protein
LRGLAGRAIDDIEPGLTTLLSNPLLDGVAFEWLTLPKNRPRGPQMDNSGRGVSGNLSGNVHRSRHALNSDTIREMHAAFQRGGRAAINKVMKQQPAVFLKWLVLLVPREMRVEQSGGVKSMTDEQIEQAIDAIRTMLAARAGQAAPVIEGTAETVALPAPDVVPNGPNKVMDAVDTAVGARASNPEPAR